MPSRRTLSTFWVVARAHLVLLWNGCFSLWNCITSPFLTVKILKLWSRDDKIIFSNGRGRGNINLRKEYFQNVPKNVRFGLFHIYLHSRVVEFIENGGLKECIENFSGCDFRICFYRQLFPTQQKLVKFIRTNLLEIMKVCKRMHIHGPNVPRFQTEITQNKEYEPLLSSLLYDCQNLSLAFTHTYHPEHFLEQWQKYKEINSLPDDTQCPDENSAEAYTIEPREILDWLHRNRKQQEFANIDGNLAETDRAVKMPLNCRTLRLDVGCIPLAGTDIDEHETDERSGGFETIARLLKEHFLHSNSPVEPYIFKFVLGIAHLSPAEFELRNGVNEQMRLYNGRDERMNGAWDDVVFIQRF